MIRKLSSSGMAAFQSHSTMWSASTLSFSSGLMHWGHQRSKKEKASCGRAGFWLVDMGRWDFTPSMQSSCAIWHANEPCLGASQLLPEGHRGLAPSVSLFRHLRERPKPKKLLANYVSVTRPRVCKMPSGVWKSNMSVFTQSHKKLATYALELR